MAHHRVPLVRRNGGTTGSDDAAFADVLRTVVAALGDMPFGVLGGVASAAYGRPRWTKDIDVFCRADDARCVLDILERHEFDVELTNPTWIYKAWRHDVLVDVIFKVKSEVYFDNAMLERIRRVEFEGVEVPILAPEDIVVTKAIAGDEESPWHWYDALGIIAVNELDWDYLLERARKSPNRVISLLHYAISIDIPVSMSALRRLHESVMASWE
jgi:predicted nucleotidyltransferase